MESVYIINHGEFYEYENIIMVFSDYNTSKDYLNDLVVVIEFNDDKKFVEIKKDYWEWKNHEYYTIKKYNVY